MTTGLSFRFKPNNRGIAAAFPFYETEAVFQSLDQFHKENIHPHEQDEGGRCKWLTFIIDNYRISQVFVNDDRGRPHFTKGVDDAFNDQTQYDNHGTPHEQHGC